jgi:hypothetical protein
MASSALIAAAVVRARRDIAEALRGAGAVSPEAAVAFEPHGRLQRRMLERLAATGAVRTTPLGLYWLDEEKLAQEEAKRRRQALVFITAATAAAAAAAVATFVLVRL